MNVTNIKKLFQKKCFTICEYKLVPLHEGHEYKEKYVVKPDESLESIAERMQKGEEEFSNIANDFKTLDERRYDSAWEYLAEFNYGSTEPSVVNWMMCKTHGFDKNSNITGDKKNYKYKGGEILYYPSKFRKAKTGQKHPYIELDDTPGLILHPSFACPALVGTDSMLSILVLGNPEKAKIIPEKANIHLKIVPWSDKIGQIKHLMLQGKKYHDFPKALFDTNEEARKNIKCEKINFKKKIEDPNGRFCFIPEQKVIKTFKDYGYKELYRIEIHLKYLPAGEKYLSEGYYNLFWINLNKEREDEIIQRKMNYFFGKKIYKSSHDKWYGFAVETKSIFFDKLQPKYPVCSYHPALYKKKDCYNIAHMADLHLSSRLTLLRRSQAKVVEADDVPTVGSLLNDHFETVYDLFGQAGRDPDIDMVLISGDIIDYLKSFYPVAFIDKRNKLWEQGDYGPAFELNLDKFYKTVGSIWDAVGVSDKDEANKKYQDCVDLITVYSIIQWFYQTHKKPVFVVSGNHDAYYYPYGVSPRIPIYGKANPGIPADMNLTVYEAILSYGKKSGKIIKSYFEPSIKEDKFEILYSLFTPMKDFVFVLPKFTLIGLSWGEDEDIIDLADKIPIIGPIIGRDGQGVGHLPRADEAISDDQMEKIIEFALQKSKTTNILFSHFTFVSYEESKSLSSFEEGDVEFDWHWEASEYDMGTFEKNRKKIYEKYLYKERKLHYILTGHSHRRGLYEITDIDYWGDNSVKTRFYGFSYHNKISGPKVIVSDSAGPIPRYNYDGEFSGWGSAIPSFTKMVFQDGNLSELTAVVSRNVNARPRFAVALDYLYVIKKFDVIGSFELRKLSKWHYVKLTKFTFNLQWNQLPLKKKKYKKYLDIANLDIEQLAIYFHYNKKFHKIPIHSIRYRSNNNIECELDFGDKSTAERFRTYACDYDKRTVYASIKFKKLTAKNFSHYNYASSYNFEIQIQKHNAKQHIDLSIKRDHDHNENPDLTWREENYRDKYGNSEE